MKNGYGQGEAVIQLHDIARFVERNFELEDLAFELRRIADTLNKATPKDSSELNL
jgi:hypothetical protein